MKSETMSNLPDELSEEILVRSPASSLVRFKLVCKKWRSLISNPDFVRKHLSYSSINHHKLIINSSPNFSSIDCKSLDLTKHKFPFETTRDLSLLGACNGLLCMCLVGYTYCGLDSTIFVWNPVFKDYKFLPRCYDFNSVCLVGFGYDSTTDDYKFVRVSKGTEYKVFIFTLKTLSWKRIQSVPTSKFCNPCRAEGTLVNGSLYWASSDYHAAFRNLIIGFDLVNEKFRVVEVHDYVDIKPQRKIELLEIGGCLGMFQAKYEFHDIEMWTLKEDESKNEYWSKFMRIQRNYGMYSWPVCFMKNDEVVLSINGIFDGEDKKLAVYDSKNASFRKVYGFGKGSRLEEKVYFETLVSVNVRE